MEDKNGTQGPKLSRALAWAGAAGLAGGLAEVAFMWVYSSVTGLNPAEILKLIAFTFFDAPVAFGPNGLWAGLLIHFALSLAIGLTFGLFVHAAFRGSFSYSRALVWGPLALAAIWAVNFYILLPMYNGAFVQMVRPEAAFFSKLSFGVVLALAVAYARPAGKKRSVHGSPAGLDKVFDGPSFRGEVIEGARISEKDIRGLVS